MSIRHRVRVRQVERRSSHFNRVDNTQLDWQRSDGRWQPIERETVDHGDGAVVLLYDPRRRTVVLLRQFRYACFINGLDDLLVEAPAGLLDGASPEDCVRAEAEQEVGFRVRRPRQVFDAYMSPGSLCERLYGFVAEYDHDDRVGAGGGLLHEGEDIEVLELPFDEALAMLADGRIRDAKTIMLLQYAALHLFPRRA
ncbi:MAG: NUDIX domain-containing protein [Proteobacteria bacterium]|nr:NUDIX domain-containing protein [Pseudomonadota bacterium]